MWYLKASIHGRRNVENLKLWTLESSPRPRVILKSLLRVSQACMDHHGPLATSFPDCHCYEGILEMSRHENPASCIQSPANICVIYRYNIYLKMHIDTKSVLNAAGTLTAVCHDVGSHASESFEKSPWQRSAFAPTSRPQHHTSQLQSASTERVSVEAPCDHVIEPSSLLFSFLFPVCVPYSIY